MTAHGRSRGALGPGLERFARRVTEWTGSSLAFAGATGFVVLWAITGPLFHFSDTWQLVINTFTSIVTFLMVVLIQRSQNEIVAAIDGASNRLINVEDLTEEEVRTLREYYRKLVEIARREESLTRSHSIEEAAARARDKRRRSQALNATASRSGA